MASIARTIRRRAQRRRLGPETLCRLGSVANVAHLATSIGQIRLADEETFMPQAVPGRAVQDNADLPVAVIADTLAAMGEARARASIAVARLAGLGSSEPGVTAGRRRR
jgi:hypothetical protein